jgi:hypothetical protein
VIEAVDPSLLVSPAKRVVRHVVEHALSAKVEFCTEPFVIAGLCVRHLWLWHIAFETQAATIPMGQCLFPRLFALRYTHDFEGDLAIILSNNLAFEPHT